MSRMYRGMSIVVLLALLLGGCQPIQPMETVGPVETQAVPSPLEEALTGKYAGTTVDLGGVWPEGWVYEGTFEAFEEQTGIDVQYRNVDEMSTDLYTSLVDGTGPDIVEYTHASPMVDLARQGKVVDITTFLPMETLQQRYDQQWLDWATLPGPDGPIVAGLYATYYLKSVVWYPKAAFDEAGYTIPTTWDEMLALSDQIVADGGVPWCIENGFWGGLSVGVPAAGWVQDIMLRTVSPEEYDQWTRGELKSSSPQVKRAVELMADIWLKPGYTTASGQALNALMIGDLNDEMMASPPQCWLTREPSWIVALYPLAGEFGQDYAFFNLPPIDPAYGQPVQLEGHFVAMFQDRPEVRALMEYFSTGAQVEAWIQVHEGGDWDNTFSPVKDVGLALHTTEKDRATLEMVQNADSLGFSASDLMPMAAAIQLGKSLSDYIAGTIDLDTALAQVDAAWPTAAPEQAYVSALEEARAGKYTGTTVTMQGPWPPEWAPFGTPIWGPEILGPFEEQTGIEVDYSWWNNELNPELQLSLEMGTGPDVVEFTNPYPMAHLARLGKVVDISTLIPMEYLRTRYEGPWLEYAMLPGPDGELFLSGLYTQIFVNSMVWYPLPAFEEAGYTVPETWDELMALVEQIVADGGTPWCIQNGSWGEGTEGFLATIPLSDIMLRTVSPEEYQQWLMGELKFDSPQVRRALEILAETWLQPGYHYGAPEELVTFVQGDLTPVFQATPPGCYLMLEPIYTLVFGGLEGEYGVDFGFFNLPPIDPAYGRPVQVEGHFLTVYHDRPEVRALVEYILSGEPYKVWMANQEGTPIDTMFSPHPERDGGIHQTAMDQVLMEMLYGGETLGYNACDFIPSDVCLEFQKVMVAFLEGTADLDVMLPQIDAVWATALTDLKLTILFDNTVVGSQLQSGWGFAALIEYGDHTLLFDTGADGRVLLDNMQQLGVDLQSIEAVIFSHEHEDHTTGLTSLLDMGIRPTVYVPNTFSDSFKTRVAAQTELVEVSDPLEILPGMHVTGPGSSYVEQGLVVETQKGSVVLTGCAHPGIVDMVRQAQTIVPDKVALLAGGFHLLELTDEQVQSISSELREAGVQAILPTHCTGDTAIELFHNDFAESFLEGGVGRVVTSDNW